MGVLGRVALLYGLFHRPCALAWGPSLLQGALTGGRWATLAVWTCDPGFDFVTGYHLHSELVMGLRAVVRHYLHMRFLVDVAVEPSDYMLVPLYGARMTGQSTAALRFLRLARMCRLLRWRRVARIMRVPEFEDLPVVRIGARAAYETGCSSPRFGGPSTSVPDNQRALGAGPSCRSRSPG